MGYLIGWRHSDTTGETLREMVVVRLFASDNNRILAGDCALLDLAETDNHLELKKQVEENKFHRMAMVHNFLEM
jgi:hypothetical protein